MSCDTMGRTSTLTLPNLVAKDWAQLERAIEDELEEGVARAFVGFRRPDGAPTPDGWRRSSTSYRNAGSTWTWCGCRSRSPGVYLG